MIASDMSLSLSGLSRELCHLLGWYGANGHPRVSSCRIALSRLESAGYIHLPRKAAVCIPTKWDSTIQTAAELPDFSPLCCDIKELGEIRIIRIGDYRSKKAKIWNTLMDYYHYLGKPSLVGSRIRYLLESEHHGWIGGVSFSSAAWRLRSRDTWIGWSERARRAHLDELVCNSRFLILPHLRVPNLASHVLSKALDQVGNDWAAHYGKRPLLFETFVESGRFLGTCYKASNWQHIGTSSGRGRQDRYHGRRESIKDIYVYPLHADVRAQLCEEPFVYPRYSESLSRGNDWVEEEFGGSYFGDNRLSARLVEVARDFYARPQANIPQACQSRSRSRGAYRFFENPLTDMESILQSHYAATRNRIVQESVVLAVQDTTDLNYSTHPATTDLGPLSYKSEGLIGLHVHDTMVFNLSGTPLGLIDVQCWARDFDEFGKKKERKKLPIEQKESYKWLKSYQRTIQIQKACTETTVVSVGDREADIFELFDLALSNQDHPHLLVRVTQNRSLIQQTDEQAIKLWDEVLRQPCTGKQVVKVPRKKKSPAREATLSIRFCKVVLPPPAQKSKLHLSPLVLWVVHALEETPPEGVKPLEWMLYTTMKVENFEQACEKLQWYCLRWGIEVYHRTLKSGCKIEQRQLGCAASIEACLAIDMVVGWRIFHLTKLGRETPDVPCTVFFEDSEWKAVVAFKTQNPIPPDKVPTLREMIRMVASLGGFLGRKCDREPGTQTIWLGLQRVDDITEMYRVFYPTPNAKPKETPYIMDSG